MRMGEKSHPDVILGCKIVKNIMTNNHQKKYTINNFEALLFRQISLISYF